MSVIVITGCSSGFGLLAAKSFASRGDHVFATLRHIDSKNRAVAAQLRAHAQAVGLKLEVVELDVTSDASVEAAAAHIVRQAGAPDVVINNAGQMFVGLGEAFTGAEVALQLDINVVGLHRVTRAFLPTMRAKGSGLFINISSVAGRFAVPFFSVYHASKWAVEGYSLGLRRELACTGVDVVVVEPGPFTTELFPHAPKPADADGRGKTYPQVAHDTFAGMGAAFEGMFKNPDVPTDPELVVARFLELAAMKAGTRPFRSPVGVDLGVIERNRADEALDGPFLDAMGLTAFAKLKTG